MFDNFDERKSIEYVHDEFLRGYHKFTEHQIETSGTHLLFIDGLINGISHPLIPGLIRRYRFKFDNRERQVSEIFPCLDDERIEARKLILREMGKRKIELTGSDFYFINLEPGSTRIYLARRSEYSVI